MSNSSSSSIANTITSTSSSTLSSSSSSTTTIATSTSDNTNRFHSNTTLKKSSSSSSGGKRKKNVHKVRAKKLGAYLLLDHMIGRGSFAEVYEGYRTRDNVPVAIKVISKERLFNHYQHSQQQQQQQHHYHHHGQKQENHLQSSNEETSVDEVNRAHILLEKEIQLMRNVKHVNIVRLLDVHESKRHYYLVLERCFGPNLATFLSEYRREHGTQRGIPEHLAHKFLCDIANGLQVMHSLHLAHRDLKPANLLLSRPFTGRQVGVLKIADFGFVKQMKTPGNDLSETLCGSPLYMAPEILQSRKYDASKADLWSVGVILYELLYGVPPFIASNIIDLLAQIKTMNVNYHIDDDNNGDNYNNSDGVKTASGNTISIHAIQLLRRLLQPDPEQRISFDEFIRHPYLNLTKTTESRSQQQQQQQEEQLKQQQSSSMISTTTEMEGSNSSVFETMAQQQKEQEQQQQKVVEKEVKENDDTNNVNNTKQEMESADESMNDVAPSSSSSLWSTREPTVAVKNTSNSNNNNIHHNNGGMSSLMMKYVPLDQRLKRNGALIYPTCIFNFSTLKCEDDNELLIVNRVEKVMKQSWIIAEAAHLFELALRFMESVALYCKAIELMYAEQEKLNSIVVAMNRTRDNSNNSSNNSRIQEISNWIEEHLDDLFHRVQHVQSLINMTSSQRCDWEQSREQCVNNPMMNSSFSLSNSNSNSNGNHGIDDSETLICAEQVLYKYALKLARESTQLEFLARDDHCDATGTASSAATSAALVSRITSYELNKCLAMYRRSKLLFEYLLEHCAYIRDEGDRSFLNLFTQKLHHRIAVLSS